MKGPSAYLATWNHGSAGRAALLLLVTHLGAVAVAWGAWALFLLPAFYDDRLLPAIGSWLFALTASLWLMLRFGFWGTVATRGVGHGEELLATFSPGRAVAVGLLRWALQIVMIAGVFGAAVLVSVDGRWWHLVGTAETRALGDRVAAVPIPADWELDRTEKGDDGGNHHPNLRYWLTYDVPTTYDFDDLRAWLADPAWADNPAGASFGALRVVSCDRADQTCRAQLVPPPGDPVEHFVRAELRPPAYDGDAAEVDLQVTYRQYVEPHWEVDHRVVARGRAIPVPADWVPDDEDASDNDAGQYFTRSFGVPSTYTGADLRAWLTGPDFTAPATGRPFGAVTLDECRAMDADTVRCAATVDGTWWTDGYGIERARDWVEATLRTDDHTVRLSFRRTD
ncbi:hypothetical protein [Nocardioides nitrophenolicus]|uniref:hypothetical protein n=1 Tax=Nocardioides nitrophenolicus TaxID=60489 RepID=UPI0019598DE2|nr:hypothetical protein [Nocardioides nitrophenolicus]MBM7517835.1 hypothetical protein [Nocardioides nitrophenolicus]